MKLYMAKRRNWAIIWESTAWVYLASTWLVSFKTDQSHRQPWWGSDTGKCLIREFTRFSECSVETALKSSGGQGFYRAKLTCRKRVIFRIQVSKKARSKHYQFSPFLPFPPLSFLIPSPPPHSTSHLLVLSPLHLFTKHFLNGKFKNLYYGH